MRKVHQPWQPRIESEPLFNPFVPTTEVPPEDEHTQLLEEAEEGEMLAAEASPSPASNEA